MHHARAADKRPDESHHEIDGMVRGQNAQIANPWPEWIPSGQRAALFQIILVRQHTSLWTSACSRRINDARDIFALPHHKIGRAFASKVFPAKSSRSTR